MKTIRLKVRTESHAWLNSAAREVNFVWNWANETSEKAVRRFAGKSVWLSGFDLDKLSSGASRLFDRITSETINRINAEFSLRRSRARKVRLSWRKSSGSRRSLGWVPFKAVSIKRHGNAVRYHGKTIRVFDAKRLDDVKWRAGCFAQDAIGDWWLCVPVEVLPGDSPAPLEKVGIDLGLKATVTTSDGDVLPAGRFGRAMEPRIAQAQRRGHKRQAKRLNRMAARQRSDALHKFSRKIVNTYQNIIIGDVSSSKLARTQMAKSVYDAGWAMLKTQLQYKGEHAGRHVEIVDEAFTTRACSICGALTGPKGVSMLGVRQWRCSDCGTEHDRDVNAAMNIANVPLRHQRPCAGTGRTSPGCRKLLSGENQ